MTTDHGARKQGNVDSPQDSNHGSEALAIAGALLGIVGKAMALDEALNTIRSTSIDPDAANAAICRLTELASANPAEQATVDALVTALLRLDETDGEGSESVDLIWLWVRVREELTGRLEMESHAERAVWGHDLHRANLGHYQIEAHTIQVNDRFMATASQLRQAMEKANDPRKSGFHSNRSRRQSALLLRILIHEGVHSTEPGNDSLTYDPNWLSEGIVEWWARQLMPDIARALLPVKDSRHRSFGNPAHFDIYTRDVAAVDALFNILSKAGKIPSTRVGRWFLVNERYREYFGRRYLLGASPEVQKEWKLMAVRKRTHSTTSDDSTRDEILLRALRNQTVRDLSARFEKLRVRRQLPTSCIKRHQGKRFGHRFDRAVSNACHLAYREMLEIPSTESAA
jgi:hypothetical protein